MQFLNARIQSCVVLEYYMYIKFFVNENLQNGKIGLSGTGYVSKL